jgi:glucokinase
LLNPEVVILGGGVAEVGELLLKPIRQHIHKYVLPLHLEALRIIQAELGYEAGVMGAVALALEASARRDSTPGNPQGFP